VEELKIKIGSIKNPIFVDFKTYEGRKIIDVRKFFVSANSDQEYLPTKKGISFNVNQFNEFVQVISKNQDKIQKFFDDVEFEDSQVLETFNANKLGRAFEFEFSGAETIVNIDQDFYNSKLSKISTSKILLAFYLSLTNVIEDEGDINLVLDSLDSKLKVLR
jgi:hypothetical protein